MAERFVIVHRSFDPVQTEMLGDVLRDAGLAARVIGTRSGAAIGVGQVALQVHIEVPASQAGQATDVLESFLAADGAALLREQGAYGDDSDAAADDDADDAAPRTTPRRPLLAAGVALLLPLGTGHVYVGRPWTAAVIFAGHMLALRTAMAGSWSAIATAIGLFATLVAGDVIGSILALRPPRAGAPARPAGALRQLAIGVSLVGVGLGVGKLLASRTAAPEWYRASHVDPAQAPALAIDGAAPF